MSGELDVQARMDASPYRRDLWPSRYQQREAFVQIYMTDVKQRRHEMLERALSEIAEQLKGKYDSESITIPGHLS